MSDTMNNETYQILVPSAELKELDRLVGTWQVSGPDISGQVIYSWMEGGFFLMQHVDLEQYGQKIKGIEIIGQDKGFGAEKPSEAIRSRYYDSVGNTFKYTYELQGNTLIIWGGDKGSPAYYKGEFSEDGNRNSGAWVYPGGGGYESTMTRIK
jgi:hypothetical protein